MSSLATVESLKTWEGVKLPMSCFSSTFLQPTDARVPIAAMIMIEDAFFMFA
jgi:hypothetical protein